MDETIVSLARLYCWTFGHRWRELVHWDFELDEGHDCNCCRRCGRMECGRNG